MGEAVVTLHHRLHHHRLPWARCHNPKHTTSFCKTKSEHLQDIRARGHRIFDGVVKPFTVGPVAQYKHTDADSLATFWKNMVVEMARPTEDGALAEPATPRRPDMVSTENSSSSHGRPATETTALTLTAWSEISSRPAQAGPAAASGETTITVDGTYTIVRNKASKSGKIEPHRASGSVGQR
ncbi:hypothetical protein PC129_g23453 [Phytophthora cactorum]|uniref:Uncharacterized protein n=1 Tax=Phytophthora cactorum TaxID=29920 RepID=A0A329REW0_9STRA|nr:hypothetical protein Pcac1_g21819 [Phytophthora cactorum]KAG2794079.1 hypothetical protein PC111_g22758 [Phytophthora cactorum]KAG2796728.1 hypothetical protein PC112_g22084 [Phytophthora cactorum]KAG2817910.1 hypothetical protein PC113_g22916 [Phytophthora cactorum]KAG2873789.1 hypothetical protein PC114_g25664 [Phytophthora cactorum]